MTGIQSQQIARVRQDATHKEDDASMQVAVASQIAPKVGWRVILSTFIPFWLPFMCYLAIVSLTVIFNL